jgi:hypothetical protein
MNNTSTRKSAREGVDSAAAIGNTKKAKCADEKVAPTTPLRRGPAAATAAGSESQAASQPLPGDGGGGGCAAAVPSPRAPVRPDVPLRLVQARDENVKKNGRFVRVTPFRVTVRILENSYDNPCTTFELKPGESQRQKMSALGVQSDGSALILEQWTTVEAFDQAVSLCINLESAGYDSLSENDQTVLNNNLDYICKPKGTHDVLVSVVVGNLPTRIGSKAVPAAIVQPLNDFDEQVWPHAICKIKIPPVARITTVAIELTPHTVAQYKATFNGQDPTKWTVNVLHAPSKKLEPEMCPPPFTEETFFD